LLLSVSSQVWHYCASRAAAEPRTVSVRHEVAYVAVMTVKTGRNLMFCHQYPTSACVTSDGGVRSGWDNVASSTLDGHGSASGRGDRQHHGGRELGWRSMVNTSESLINVVNANKRKVLNSPEKAQTLGPKGKWSGTGAPNSPVADDAPPAEKRDLTYAGTYVERKNPVISPFPLRRLAIPRDRQGTKGKRAARRAYEMAGMGGWRKRMPSCNETDKGCVPVRTTSPHAKAGRRPSGLSARESLSYRQRKQADGDSTHC